MTLRNAVLSLSILLMAIVAPGTLLAQSGAGSLRGRITGTGDAALAGVTVTATETGTNASRVTVSALDGFYQFRALAIGDYVVEAAHSGFTTVLLSGVRINVASARELDIALESTDVEEQVTITTDAPLVEKNASIGTIVSRAELENLPLNGRHYAELGALAPGTSTSIQPDPTKPGQPMVAMSGGIGRGVNYVVDGGDNTDDTIGGALQDLHLESVAELRIQTQQYAAEFGRSNGGVISVVTKSGTNELEGSVFAYVRDDSLNGETETEARTGAGKSPYARQQYGFALGGPIVRDRAHYFVAYEKSDQETEYVVDSGGIDPALDGRSFALPFDDELVTGKATMSIWPRQWAQARFGYQENAGKYGASPYTAPDALSTITNDYNSLLAGYTWQFGANGVNELLLQYSSFDSRITADSHDPALVYPSGFTSGQSADAPQSVSQRKRQLRDDLSRSVVVGGRRHDLKAGFNYVDEPTLGAGASTGSDGQFYLLEDRLGSPVTRVVYTDGVFGAETPVEQYSAYVQDDWYPSDRLTINAGLRYDYWKGFALDQRANPIWIELSAQTQFDDYYLRDFQGGRGGVLENDDDNWGPRIGFTYDLTGEARSFVRGGWGIYYGFPHSNSTILLPAAAVQSNFGIAYDHYDPTGIRNADGSYYAPGQPLPPNQLPPGGYLPPPNEVASPTLATPKSTQASLGYATELGGWVGVTVDLVSIRYRDVPYRFRANPTLDANGNHQSSRRFPEFASFRIWMGDGEADYEALNLGLRARLTNKLELQGFYTWSKTEGNVLAGADDFRLTNSLHQPDWSRANDASVDALDPKCDDCFGPLNTDAQHRVTLSALFRGPWEMTVAAVFRYRSALPYTRLAGTDLDGDSFASDLAPGVDHVNDARGDDFSQLDLRFSKLFRIGDAYGLEAIAEVYNLFDAENPAAFDRTGTPHAFAGDPLQGEQRLMQIGARFTF